MTYDRRLYKFLYMTFVLFGIICRIYLAKIHFTSGDDFGVATTILNGMNYGNGWNPINSIMGFVSMRMFHWTYAPLQFVFTSLLLNPSMSYEQLAFWGRIPSVILGTIAIVLIGKIIRNIYGEDYRGILGLFVTALLAFNCECILYSAQMESYEIGVVCTLVIIAFIFRQLKCEFDIKTSILMSILCYAQYQMFVFVFSFYLLFFLVFLKKKNFIQIRLLIKSAFIMGVCCLPCFAYFFLGHMYNRGVAWNRGYDNKYLFDVGRLSVGYIRDFFLGNIYDYFYYLILPGKVGHYVLPLLYVFIIVSLVGLIAFIFEKTDRFYLGIYIYIVLFIYLVLILKGSLTLSPSRHMLVMVPITIICMAEGIYFLISVSARRLKSVIRLCVYGGIAIYILLFALGVPEQIELRRNRLNEQYFLEKLQAYDVLYSYYYGMEPYVMLRSEYDVYDENIYNYIIKDKDYKYDDSIQICFWATESSEPNYDKAIENLVESGTVPEEIELELLDEVTAEWGTTPEYADVCLPQKRYGEYIKICGIKK